LIFPFPDVRGQMVQMDSSKSGFVGSQVELRCQFVNSSKYKTHYRHRS